MVAPSREVKAQLLATCLSGVMASPEAWRDYENEALDLDRPPISYQEWALDRANNLARAIWIEACKPPKQA
jgi:hypothetical protein